MKKYQVTGCAVSNLQRKRRTAARYQPPVRRMSGFVEARKASAASGASTSSHRSLPAIVAVVKVPISAIERAGWRPMAVKPDRNVQRDCLPDRTGPVDFIDRQFGADASRPGSKNVGNFPAG